MFIPENTYARNRKNPDAIVYLTTNGEICLTRDDFESEEEFLRWKAWSDKNYQEQAHHDRPFHDNTYLTGDYESAAAWMEISGGTEETGGRLDAQSGWNRFRAVYPHVKRALTKKQRRRLELFLHGMTVGEISQAEGVPHQDISKSIAAAKRKLVKIMKKLENFYQGSADSIGKSRRREILSQANVWKAGNTLCIARLPNGTDGAKDPPLGRRRWIRRFLQTGCQKGA